MRRGLHVAIVVPGFSASDRDWCIPALLTLVRRLAAAIDLEIFTLRYPAPARSYDVASARVHALGGGDARGLAKATLLGRAVGRVIAAHRRRPFDVVHGLWADEPGAVAVAAGAVLRRPAAVSLMGGELVSLPEIGYGVQNGRIGRMLVGYAIARATVVTAGSEALVGAVPATSRPIVRMPLGVDVDRFNPRVAPAPLAGSVRILHVASLTPVKDHDTLLTAMGDVAQRTSAHLHLVGDGPLADRLRNTVQEFGLRDRVTFHGAVPHDRLPPFYSAADICVVSSRYESQSMAALEACASGRAVVGTAVGILPELAPAARVVAPGDAAALGRAILAVAADEELRRQMGHAGRIVAETTFSLDRTVPALLGLYAEIRATAQASRHARG
jgi:glycosyltransferase involved in cell wall biosynthesis